MLAQKQPFLQMTSEKICLLHADDNLPDCIVTPNSRTELLRCNVKQSDIRGVAGVKDDAVYLYRVTKNNSLRHPQEWWMDKLEPGARCFYATCEFEHEGPTTITGVIAITTHFIVFQSS